MIGINKLVDIIELNFAIFCQTDVLLSNTSWNLAIMVFFLTWEYRLGIAYWDCSMQSLVNYRQKWFELLYIDKIVLVHNYKDSSLLEYCSLYIFQPIMPTMHLTLTF